MKLSKRTVTTALGALAVAGVVGGVVAVTGSGVEQAALDDDVAGVGGAPWSQTYAYTGTVQYVDVPPDTDQMTLVATGGDGGALGDSWPSCYGFGAGAVVTGTIAVTPGERVAISVGAAGQKGDTGSANPGGGWGGLGMTGGDGKGESDHARTSAGGGGATTVQVTSVDGSTTTTLLVAAGGGGFGGASGDPDGAGQGGNAGTAWLGQKGDGASEIMGGSGGAAGAAPTGAGAAGGHASGEGGDGGGGGGGVSGGGGGGGAKAASAGGGGGSGTSVVTGLTGTSIAQRYPQQLTPPVQDGTVLVTWADV